MVCWLNQQVVQDSAYQYQHLAVGLSVPSATIHGLKALSSRSSLTLRERRTMMLLVKAEMLVVFL